MAPYGAISHFWQSLNNRQNNVGVSFVGRIEIKNEMKAIVTGITLVLLGGGQLLYSQRLVQEYQPAPLNKVQRIGKETKSVLPYISKGYTLYLPAAKNIRGTLVFFEDAGFEKKNKMARLLYDQANQKGFAVLSISTEIPLDFFFKKSSLHQAQEQLKMAVTKYALPTNNVFFLGVGLSGHRALSYLKYIAEEKPKPQLNIRGVVVCDSALDWVRQYNEGARDVRINQNKGAVWEGKLTTYLLASNLGGTPAEVMENYLNFSIYSYSDTSSRHIAVFKNIPFRTYMQEAIQYWLKEKKKTPFDNNGPDMVGLVAELQMAGNKDASLTIIYPKDSKSEKKNVEGTWISVDKLALMQWIDERVRTERE